MDWGAIQACLLVVRLHFTETSDEGKVVWWQGSNVRFNSESIIVLLVVLSSNRYFLMAGGGGGGRQGAGGRGSLIETGYRLYFYEINSNPDKK